ncbi:hypothetical protein EYF80_062645 [Liparis tanakae]|uniref:Uncharacterized protein n=1 Tax=Liparis tanakae TaxID=230148 RepID=A0A4Z2EET7_9TELE|nr:hypothetical protein EYF80_062645 [Liparis tanakae]
MQTVKANHATLTETERGGSERVVMGTGRSFCREKLNDSTGGRERFPPEQRNTSRVDRGPQTASIRPHSCKQMRGVPPRTVKTAAKALSSWPQRRAAGHHARTHSCTDSSVQLTSSRPTYMISNDRDSHIIAERGGGGGGGGEEEAGLRDG